MLSEALDQVVLVKGWKKGANWSFPRGKINKDEDDLDCAVREVYEETGLDVREAGLVRDEKEMKYIEVTMREQHMRLYVFRGVPMDTPFQPRTRKEISKIEWYKLTDLPTLKKHKHKDSNENDHHTMSANKFYMVAPFLAPLKKWIIQQKKVQNRYSSNLAAPPTLAEESELEAVPTHTNYEAEVSDLPEVTVSTSKDPTQQLKDLFGIGTVAQPSAPKPTSQLYSSQPQQHTPMPHVDAAKSNALLALLRGSSTAELRASPHTSLEQATFPPEIPRSPHQSHVRSTPRMQTVPPPHFDVRPEMSTSPPKQKTTMPPAQVPVQATPPPGLGQPSYAPGPSLRLPGFPNQFQQPPQQRAPADAPYRQTGDPDFAYQQSAEQDVPRVPPASALPKMTSHTKSLLDMFRRPSPAPQSTTAPAATPKQNLLDLFKQPARLPPSDSTQGQNQQHAPLPYASPSNIQSKPAQQARDAQANNLLQFFGQQPPSTAPAARPLEPPAELAAATTPYLQHAPVVRSQEDTLLALLRQQKTEKSNKKQTTFSQLKEGETSATLSSPLNQPTFEAIPQRHRESPDGLGRSPLTTHRTLFDPKQPAQVKIMSRPESPRQLAPKSPRPTKTRMSGSSPRRSAKVASKEPGKLFQPQILKRPQTSEGPETPTPAAPPVLSQTSNENVPATKTVPMSREVSSENGRLVPDRKMSRVSPVVDQKQTLLSLFGGSNGHQTKAASQTPSRVVSPLSMSQVLSPKEDGPISAIDAQATRSRMDSLVSVASGISATRPTMEKRQTAAEDKQFLLGFLGKIASQDG